MRNYLDERVAEEDRRKLQGQPDDYRESWPLEKTYAYRCSCRPGHRLLLFTQRNQKSCPVLEVSDVGSRELHYIASDVDIARDIPKYRIYRKGELAGEYTSVEEFWQDDFVSFLIGCSFSFESGLLEVGVPVRQIEEGRNVPISGNAQRRGLFLGSQLR